MKKFFSAFLLMAAMAFSVSTFVSCNDLTQEMEDVKAQATQNAAAIDALETQITALQSALATAQATADAAKKAGEDAAAAAAQAKADAIKEAKAECEIVKAALEAKIAEINTALAGKASKEELQAAIDQATKGLNDLAATIGARIDGIEAGLNKLATVAQLNEEVAKLLAADTELKLQIQALKNYADTTYATVEEAEAIRADLTALAEENYNELYKLIGNNASAIQATIDTVDVIAAGLKELIDINTANIDEITGYLMGVIEQASDNATAIAALEEAIKGIVGDIKTIDEKYAAEILRVSEQIVATNEYLDKELAELVNADKQLGENMSTMYNALTLSVETLGTDIRAEIAKVKTELEGKITTAVNTLQNNLTEKYDTAISTLHTLLHNLLRSITFVPDYFIDGIEAVPFFNSLVYVPMTANTATKINDAVICVYDEDAVFEFDKVLSVAPVDTINYHFNPGTYEVQDTDVYNILVKHAENIQTRAAKKEYAYFSSVQAPVKDGKLYKIPVRRANIWQTMVGATDETLNLLALEATVMEEGAATTVTSQYVRFVDNPWCIDDIAIADKDGDKIGDNDADYHFATTYVDAQKRDPQYKVIYNKQFDLKSLIETHVTRACKELDLAAYELKYQFSKPTVPYYVSEDETKTNQQTVIELTDAEAGLYDVTEGFGLESVGRTPILCVEILDKAGNIVRRGYVKVEIVVEKAADIEENTETETHKYLCPTDKITYDKKDEKLNVEWFRQNIYREMTELDGKTSISHELFWDIYGGDQDGKYAPKRYVTDAAGNVLDVEAPQIINGVAADGRETKDIEWTFTAGKAYAAFKNTLGTAGKTLYGVVEFTNRLASSRHPQTVTIKMPVHLVLETPAFKVAPAKNLVYWTADEKMFKSNVNWPDTKFDGPENCQFQTYLNDAFVAGTQPCKTALNIPCGARDWKIVKLYSYEGWTPSKTIKDVELVPTNDGCYYITVNKNSENAKKALNSETGLYATLQYVYNYATKDGISKEQVVLYTLDVKFIQPVHMLTPSGLQVQDAKTGGDKAEYNFANLFYDWRGEYIIPIETITPTVQDPAHFWKKVCTPHVQYVPGYTYQTPGHYEFETETVTLETAVETYGARVEAELWYNCLIDNEVVKVVDTKTFVTDHNNYAKPADAIAALEAKIAEANNAIVAKGEYKASNGKVYTLYHDKFIEELEIAHTLVWAKKADATAVPVPGKSKTITYISNVTYVPGETVEVEEQFVTLPCNEQPGPDTVAQFGDIIGCWQYTEAYNEVDGEPYKIGQYWDFYGDWTFDVIEKDIHTNLPYNKGQLPSGVTLVTDNFGVVEYYNIGTPVEYSYEIYIPVKVTCGWATFNKEIVVTVVPANSQPAE